MQPTEWQVRQRTSGIGASEGYAMLDRHQAPVCGSLALA